MSLSISKSSFSGVALQSTVVTNGDLISQLKNQNPHVRLYATEALSNRELSPPDIDKVRALTKSEYDNIIRGMALEILGSALDSGTHTSKEIISDLVALLQDHNESLKIKDVAGHALLKQADLSEETIAVVIDSLKNGSKEDKMTLIHILGTILSGIRHPI